MRSARIELVLVGVIALALVVLSSAFGASRKNHDDPRRSTFNDGRLGLHALHLLVEGLDAGPRRQRSAPQATDPVDRTLVVAHPSEPITTRETHQLVEWVAAGGRLVLVGGPPATGTFVPYVAPLFEAFGLAMDPPLRPGATLDVGDAALREDLGPIDWPQARAIAARGAPDRAGPLERLVVSGEQCVVGRLAFDDAGGEVVAVADAGFLDNTGLAKGDNAVLAARLLLGTPASGRRITFDEFHHGFREGGGTDHLASVLGSMLVGTWPGRAVLVAALAGLLYLAGAAVRLGAPDPMRPAPRRAMSEHADALGRLLETARARSEALQLLAAGARRVVGPRAGIPTALPPAEFTRRLRSFPTPGATELADALDRAETRGASKDVEMEAAAANLARAKRRFLHGDQ